MFVCVSKSVWHLSMYADPSLISSSLYSATNCLGFIFCLFLHFTCLSLAICVLMCVHMHMNVFIFAWVSLPAVKLLISEELNKM